MAMSFVCFLYIHPTFPFGIDLPIVLCEISLICRLSVHRLHANLHQICLMPATLMKLSRVLWTLSYQCTIRCQDIVHYRTGERDRGPKRK